MKNGPKTNHLEVKALNTEFLDLEFGSYKPSCCIESVMFAKRQGAILGGGSCCRNTDLSDFRVIVIVVVNHNVLVYGHMSFAVRLKLFSSLCENESHADASELKVTSESIRPIAVDKEIQIADSAA